MLSCFPSSAATFPPFSAVEEREDEDVFLWRFGDIWFDAESQRVKGWSSELEFSNLQILFSNIEIYILSFCIPFTLIFVMSTQLPVLVMTLCLPFSPSSLMAVGLSFALRDVISSIFWYCQNWAREDISPRDPDNWKQNSTYNSRFKL